MGRRDGNHAPQENNSIEDTVGNKEKGYPMPDPNKMSLRSTVTPTKNPQRENLGRNH
jgi:hypothetical protein